MRNRNEEYLARKRERDNARKRKKRAAAKAAAAPVVPVTLKPNRQTIVFRRPVEMTKAEMYEMLATAAANTARM